MSIQDVSKAVLEGMDELAGSLQWKNTPILKSNKAINSLGKVSNNPLNTVGKFVMGESDTGIRGTLSNLASGGDDMSIGKAIKNAYHHQGGDKVGKLNWGAVTGTYVGAAAVGRVATGGGIYRDSNGNVDIPIVPFV